MNRVYWRENVSAFDLSMSLNVTLTYSPVSAPEYCEVDLMYIMTARLIHFTFALGSFMGLDVTSGGDWPLQLVFRSNKKRGKSIHPLGSNRPKYRLHKYLCHDTLNDLWFLDFEVTAISRVKSIPSCLLHLTDETEESFEPSVVTLLCLWVSCWRDMSETPPRGIPTAPNLLNQLLNMEKLKTQACVDSLG